MKLISVATICFLMVFLFGIQAMAVEVKLLDSKEYKRTKGKPNVYTDTFAGETGKGRIIVLNGKRNGEMRVSSAKVYINNQLIFREKNFKKKDFSLEKEISLKTLNTIQVKLNSAPKSYLTISVIGESAGSGAGVIGPAGGVVTVTDEESDIFGATITFEPNALDKDTVISISGNLSDIPDSNHKLVYINLEPSGLIFSTPATLEIPFDSSATASKSLLFAFMYSNVNPLYHGVIEDSRWEPLSILVSTDNSFEVEVNHFSLIAAGLREPLYTILHLPGKYLKEADLIFSLELWNDEPGELDWFPGHVGMYLGTLNATEDLNQNDGITMIDANNTDGVKKHQGYENFRKNSNKHIFMGARRYSETLTSEDRKKIAEYAIDKDGKGYFVIGEGNLTDWAYSCVGLTEAAYDSADKSIIPGLLEFPFILPIEQFIRTVPVSEIDVKVGEIIEIPIRGVLLEDVPWDNDKYKEINVTDTIALRPDIGMFFNNNHFFWQPPESGTFLVGFTSDGIYDGEFQYDIQTLTIKVEENNPQSYYLSEGAFTSVGGGTWGPVLTLWGEVSNTDLILTVTKSDYTPWQSSGEVYWYEGSLDPGNNFRWHEPTYEGKTMSVTYIHDLSRFSVYPRTFWVKYIPNENNGEYAWVGPIAVDKK